MAFEEAMKYGGKVILGDRPVQVSYLADCCTELFWFFVSASSNLFT